MSEVKAGSKTETMMRLNDEGMTVGQIAREMGVKYQQVYNTLKMKQCVVKLGKEVGEESKSAAIRRLLKTGMTRGEVANELGVSYQFVYNVENKK